MAKIDLTVRGAGIFGLTIAWTATRRGARVCVADPAGPGAGASGGVVGALAPHTPDAWTPKKAFQRDSLATAAAAWAEVQEGGGVDPGYARIGRLQPIGDAAALDLARDRAAAATANWPDDTSWEVVPVADLGSDWAPAAASGFCVHDTLSARVAPRAALSSLAAAITARGGVVVADAPDAGAVVHATGPSGLASLSADLGATVGVSVKGQAARLRADPGPMPMIYDRGLYVVPQADGTVAVGSTSERDYANAAGTDAALDALIDAARALPALAAAPVVERWAGLRPRARSRAPMLGPWPGRPGHYIANGGFKIGFGVAWGVAELICDLVLEGRDRIPADFAVAASLPKSAAS